MKKIILFCALTLIAILPPLTAAQARIDIVPRKIVIENRDRGAELTILNLSGDVSTFRMELVSFRQDENGIYKKLEQPLSPVFNPDSIVRFSPRQFTLKKGGRQKIRLSVRKPANLPEGEYRFHIKALRLAQPDLDRLEDGIYMHANIGVTIPVVVRHGNTNVSAKLSNLQIVDPARTKNNQPQLHFDINREGTESAIGTLEAFWRPNGGTEKKIGHMGHMNVFTDVNKRRVKMPLTEMPYGVGSVFLRYSKELDEGEIYDEVTLQR